MKLRNFVLIPLLVFFLLVMVLVTIPFAFKGKLTEMARQELNNQLVADVDFNRLNISLIKNFPNASVTIKDLSVTGRDDFEGDTLIFSRDVQLVVNMKSIFKGEGFEVKKFLIKDAKVFAHELIDGRVNWDIMPPDSVETEQPDSELKFLLEDVQIRNADIIYVSDTSRIAAQLKNTNIRLQGDFTSSRTVLDTKLTIDSLNFWSDNTQLAHNLKFSFDADIDAFLSEDRYVLQNNKMIINAVPLSLDGWLQLLDEGMEMDFKLNSENVDFKSLLSLVPAIYSNSFDQLTADGKVSLSGFLKGKLQDDLYPAFDLDLKVDNGRFKYPDLPKSIDNFNLAGRLTSPGGLLDNTVVDISRLNFSMGGNPVSARLHVEHPMSDPDFRVNAAGKLDLGMVKDVFPLEKGTELNGLLDMDINAAGKMSYVEQNRYESFRFGGHMNVKEMLVKMEDLPQTVEVKNADMTFSDRFLNLSDLSMKLGENDFNLKGRVENYLAYMLRDQALKGELNLLSNRINLNDFMTGDSNDTTSMQVIEVPKNLNLTLAGKIGQLLYADMDLTNAEAQLQIADGVLNINKMNMNAFGGTMALNGKYSTIDLSKPGIDFDLDLKQVSIADVLKQVESLRKFAPILDKLAGRFNTKLSLNTLLAGDMMPILSSVLSTGSFKAEFLTLKEEVAALNELAKMLKIDKMNNFSLKDLAMAFEIKEGKLITQPFNLKIKDYTMKLGGSTGLDQSIDYAGTFRLPDNLNLGRFQDVGFKIGGNFTKPKVELDLKNTLTSLVDEKKELAGQKIDSVKTELLDKGRAELDKALQEAEKKAAAILETAKKQSEKLLEQAKIQGDSLVAKAQNPIARELARKGADELIKRAQKQADNINEKAKVEADKMIHTAREKGDL